MINRASGILLHLTSLPSAFGIGDMGPRAYQFADFLSESGQQLWQILPLTPPDPVYGSPYFGISAFAGNPLVISPELLVEDDLLLPQDLASRPPFSGERVDFKAVCTYKESLFNLAHERFKTCRKTAEFDRFCRKNAFWLDDFSLFSALKTHFKGTSWADWPQDIRDRDARALTSAQRQLGDLVERDKFLQYIFEKQWHALKTYCNQKNIRIFGDIPIYMNYESADVWTHPDIFKLDKNKKPLVVSGVPPDYFSSTGQLWGNPVYRWDVLKERKYDWWIERTARNLDWFDMVRIDHFRGLVACWEVPADEKTALNGKWVEAPAEDLFKQLSKSLACLPIVAEDLGIITADVREVMRTFGFPGMKVLLFGFDESLSTNLHAPHNFERNCVVYPGTHDNNTVRGWYDNEASPQDRARLCRYLGRNVDASEIHWEMIRLAMMSVANLAVISMQDILGLGEESRMNHPARAGGNWQWRLQEGRLTPLVSDMLLEMTKLYGRD